jgi:hypothetical protein
MTGGNGVLWCTQVHWCKYASFKQTPSVTVIKEAEILGEALVSYREFLSILSRRLSFLAGELPEQPSVSEGGKGEGMSPCALMCANKKPLKTHVIKISARVRHASARSLRHFYDLRVPISYK